MKKLTASIFTVLLATVGAANAEIASKAYVDQQDTDSVTTANAYTDSKIGTYTGAAAGSETVAAAIAAAVSEGVDNAVTHTGAVGNATTPVYVTAEGVATAGTALGTMAYEAATDYTKTADLGDLATKDTVANADIAADAAIAKTKLATDVQTSLGLADTALQAADIADKADAATGLTAGTNTKITYNAQGIVTAGAALEATDIPTLTMAKISDAGALATLDEVGSAQITNGSVAAEDIADHAVTLDKVPALSSDCQATGAECVLKSASGALAWEVIKRADNGQ